MSTGERPSIHPSACEELTFGLLAGGHRLQAKTILPPGTSLTGSGPTLVFLHEALGSITQWRGFPLALASATGLPALVYDRLGHGKSEPRPLPLAPGYLETEARERLPEVLAACGIEVPFLVGHSDGGTIALLYAARFPRAPLAVITEAAHVWVEAEALQGIWRTLRAYGTTPLRERLRTHHGDRVDEVFHAWSDVWLSPAFRDWSMVGLLPALTCPVLAIQGEADEYGTPDQVRAILEAVSGPAQGLILPGCAHVPHFQAKEEVLDGMVRFIREVAADSPRIQPMRQHLG
ncbi:MAG: alpha/beta hydrolase [Holophaga sp.]|jgi:pimeloyl-ACP methyl ester carboxylesterase